MTPPLLELRDVHKSFAAVHALRGVSPRLRAGEIHGLAGKNGAFTLWDPAEPGYLAGYAAAALASGQVSGTEGEKFTAGKPGEREVGKDGEVILGPPTGFNADNIDDYDF